MGWEVLAKNGLLGVVLEEVVVMVVVEGFSTLKSEVVVAAGGDLVENNGLVDVMFDRCGVVNPMFALEGGLKDTGGLAGCSGLLSALVAAGAPGTLKNEVPGRGWGTVDDAGVLRGKNDVDGAAAGTVGLSSALGAVADGAEGKIGAEGVGKIDGLGASVVLPPSLDDGKGTLCASVDFNVPSAGLERLNRETGWVSGFEASAEGVVTVMVGMAQDIAGPLAPSRFSFSFAA
jgi:hypothetical protein